MLRQLKESTGMSDPVDVPIIGAGAFGAAVTWSLAETKMHILWLACLCGRAAKFPSRGGR
jgi:hypothetical protein